MRADVLHLRLAGADSHSGGPAQTHIEAVRLHSRLAHKGPQRRVRWNCSQTPDTDSRLHTPDSLQTPDCRLQTAPGSSAESRLQTGLQTADSRLQAHSRLQRLQTPHSTLPAPDITLQTTADPDRRLQTADSRLPTPGSRLQTAHFRLQTPDCGLRLDCKLQTPDCRLTANSRIQTADSRLEIPDSRLKLVTPGSCSFSGGIWPRGQVKLCEVVVTQLVLTGKVRRSS